MDQITRKDGITYSEAEIVAYNARKIVEGIAFGCLVAAEHGLKHVPRDAKGQYNAESIFNRLNKQGRNVLPSPSDAREATAEEKARTGATAVLEGAPSRRLTYSDLIKIYRHLHEWAHELNPYVVGDRRAYLQQKLPILMGYIEKISSFISNHVISIHGHGFFCVLKDREDGLTKVISLQKIGA
jgi:hypothetical protein